MKFLLNMNKFIFLSPKEALLIQSALAHWCFHRSNDLNSADFELVEFALTDLDLSDKIRKKLSNVFGDLSVVD